MIENISECIVYHRVVKKLKQIELAEKAGITQGILSMIETKKRIPTKQTLIKIALALELEWDYFLKLKESENKPPEEVKA